MMVNPRIGQRVQVWYRKPMARYMRLHGKVGTVVLRGTGKPRNHIIEIGAYVYCIPCGNLRKLLETTPSR